ncbi:MAG TPA: ABC transporter permease, partial [Spirochaetia bacterium]|nr:ABC transporter permease [Spirochaetia bacterium]
MRRLAKYIKPYLFLLAVAVVLLFIQAYANLALPDYMSQIVNVGIQAGGVENAVPTAIRKSEMDKLTLFMSADEAKTVLSDYQLVEPGSSLSAQYLSDYPVLSKEAVYVRKNLDSAQIAEVDPILGKAFLVVTGIQQAATNPAMAKLMAPTGTAGQGTSGAPPFDLSKLPPGMDLFTVLKMLPAERRAQIAAAIDQKFSAMGPKMVSQAAAEPVKAEYAALGVNTSKLQTSYMFRVGAIMLILTLIAALAAIATGFISARVASGLARDLRAAVFERVESFGAGEFDKFSTASLITRSTNDIMQIQMVTVMLVTMVFYAPIIGVGGIIRAFGKSTSMWWILALAVAILMTVVLVVYKLAVPKFKLMQKLMDRLNLVSRETLSGMMVIRAFNRQKHEEKRFDGANVDLTDTMLFVNRVMVVMMPIMILIMNGLSLLIIWVGSKQVAASN